MNFAAWVRYILIIATVIGLGDVKQAQAESKALPIRAIPLANDEFPATDLIYEGSPLDPDRAAELRKQGLDLATLQPRNSDVWQDVSYPATDSNIAYPQNSVEYHSILEDSPEGWFRAQVQAEGSYYRLNVSLDVHQALVRAALLRRLGFPVATPKYYSKIRIKFKDSESKKTFLGELVVKVLADDARWVVSNDEKDNSVILQDVYLEPGDMVVPTSFYMGNLNATHIQGRRILRSLLIPFVLVDVPESVNNFSWEATQIVSETAVLTHRYASAFYETTWDDVRWILARVAKFTRGDWQEIVSAGGYPSDIGQLLVEKIIARRNTLVASFKITELTGSLAKPIAYNTKISIGAVKEGKATQERYEGYALRFTHGDPDSPLKTDDLVRFLKIEAITSVIRQLTGNINEKLQYWTMDQLLQKQAQAVFKNFVEHWQRNPGKPFSAPLKVWGGPIGLGPTVRASRNVVAGSYFGNETDEFQVQLVDQLSVGGTVGFFLGVSGIKNIQPSMGGNMTVQRSYVHARPIPSVKAADKTSWKELMVPQFMTKLSQVLTDDFAGLNPEERGAKMSEAMGKFLEDLKENELFVVSDSISLGALARVNIPILPLAGLDPVGFGNSLVVGADASTMVLRRTTFTRENGKIKIYLQQANAKSFEGSLDVNFWMRIMRFEASAQKGKAHTRAFIISESPAELDDKRKWFAAIKGILQKNDSELLEKFYSPITLDHDMLSKAKLGQFLFFRWAKVKEAHRVKIRPAAVADENFDPKEFERTLFSYRQMQRTGKNYYGFLGDVLDGLLQTSDTIKPGIIGSDTGSDPADSFLGNARWNTVRLETELTPKYENRPVALLETKWTGWTISKPRFFEILDKIDARVASLKLSLPLVNRDNFNEMNRLQLYEVRTNMTIYNEGLEAIKKLLLTKPKAPDRRNAGSDEYSFSDQLLVKDFLLPLAGSENYKLYCWDLNMGRSTREPNRREQVFKGITYDCLPPWFAQILSLRRTFPASDREEQMVWYTRVLEILSTNGDLGFLIKKIGKDNLFFQVTISGFRTNDERGDTADYKSSTIGTFNHEDREGVFRLFTQKYEISSSELNAAYLSKGQ